MNRGIVDNIARAILYEGYSLYPYRSSALKNRQPWTFGTLYPPGGRDRSHLQMQCLATATATSSFSVLLRFLNSGLEREVTLESRGHESFSFSGEPTIQGEIEATAAELAPGLIQLTVTARNTSAELDAEIGAAHVVVNATLAEFVSMTDPPPELREAAAKCVNTGVWPVLIGEMGSRDTILGSPIILPDYPQVAPESTGDLHDATEIEEILTLRILTLTDEEKAEVRASGARPRALLERAESLPAEHLIRLHGAIRGLQGGGLHLGDRVRVRPRKRADIFDSLLEGRIAIVQAVERDLEDKTHVAVVFEDDPGRDLGEMRQAGHRFFYDPEELELVGERSAGPEASR